MSRDFPNSSASRIQSDSFSLSYPYSTACWVHRSSNVNASLVSTGDSDLSDERNFLATTGGGSGISRQQGGGSQNQIITSNTCSLDEWAHVVDIIQSGDTFVMLNGDEGNAASASRPDIDFSGWDRAMLGGAVAASSAGFPHDGLIAWATLWDVALTVAEAVELAAGRHPLTIRPADIQFCVPLWGHHSDEIDLIDNTRVWSIIGTCAADDRQPPIELWTPGRRVFSITPVVGITGTSAVAIPPLTTTASGTVGHPGTSAVAIPSLTTTASGTVGHPGTSAFAIPSLTTTATGVVTGAITGTSAFAIPELVTAAAGVVGHSGTSAFAIEVLQTAAQAVVGHSGVSAFVIPPLTTAATGITGAGVVITGTSAFTIPLLRVWSRGTVYSTIPTPLDIAQDIRRLRFGSRLE